MRFSQAVISKILGLADHAIGFRTQLLCGKSGGSFFSNGYGNIASVQAHRKVFMEKYIQQKCLPMDLMSNKDDSNNKITWYETKKVVAQGEGGKERGSDLFLQEGRFESPVAEHLPPVAAECQFYKLESAKVGDDEPRIYILMLAGGGESGAKGSRLRVAEEVVRKSAGRVSCLILNNAYSGSRRPSGQKGQYINTVEDFIWQYQSVIEESMTLSKYYLDKSESNRVCITGFSYGATLAIPVTGLLLRMGIPGHRLASALYVPFSSSRFLCEGQARHHIDIHALKGRNRLFVGNSDSKWDDETDAEAFKRLADILHESTRLDKAIYPEGHNMNDGEFANINNAAAAARYMTMESDGMGGIQTRQESLQIAKRYLLPSISSEVMIGGHVWGFYKRHVYHTRLINDTLVDAGWIERDEKGDYQLCH